MIQTIDTCDDRLVQCASPSSFRLYMSYTQCSTVVPALQEDTAPLRPFWSDTSVTYRGKVRKGCTMYIQNQKGLYNTHSSNWFICWSVGARRDEDWLALRALALPTRKRKNNFWHFVCVALFCWPDIGEIAVPVSFLKSGNLGWPDSAYPHCEGTGTRPDYLVNRDDPKNERPFGGKNCTKIEK